MSEVGAKQCRVCGHVKDAGSFQHKKRICKACRNAKIRAARAKGKEPVEEGRVEEVMPEVAVVPGLDPEVFRDRKRMETYLRGDFAQTISEYDATIASFGRVAALASGRGLVKESLDATKARQAALRDKATLQSTLMKHFELLASLEKDVEDDPKYTPVTLVVQAVPPAECLVDPIAEREDEEWQREEVPVEPDDSE